MSVGAFEEPRCDLSVLNGFVVLKSGLVSKFSF